MSAHNLSPAQTERITVLAEEAAEIVQACTKILRHGFFSVHPACPDIDNRARLIQELGDLRAVLAIVMQAGDLTTTEYVQAACSKLERVQQYLHEDENKVLARMVLDIHNGHG